jgi:hypothetical protein
VLWTRPPSCRPYCCGANDNGPPFALWFWHDGVDPVWLCQPHLNIWLDLADEGEIGEPLRLEFVRPPTLTEVAEVIEREYGAALRVLGEA